MTIHLSKPIKNWRTYNIFYIPDAKNAMKIQNYTLDLHILNVWNQYFYTKKSVTKPHDSGNSRSISLSQGTLYT